jgi:hypothetical protein
VSPDGFTPALLKTNAGKSRIIKVTKVYSPFLLVPGMKKKGKAACLGDFGEPPFNIIATFGMLKLHVESDCVRSFPRRLDGQAPPRVTPPAPPRVTRAATNPRVTGTAVTNPPTINLLLTSPATNLPMNPATNQPRNQQDDTNSDGEDNDAPRDMSPATNQATNQDDDTDENGDDSDEKDDKMMRLLGRWKWRTLT